MGEKLLITEMTGKPMKNKCSPCQNITQNAAGEGWTQTEHYYLRRQIPSLPPPFPRPPTENNTSLSVPRFQHQTSKHQLISILDLLSTGSWQGAHQAVHLTNVTCLVTVPQYSLLRPSKQTDTRAADSLGAGEGVCRAERWSREGVTSQADGKPGQAGISTPRSLSGLETVSMVIWPNCHS